MLIVKAAVIIFYFVSIAGLAYLAGVATKWIGELLDSQWLIDLADPSRTRPDFFLGLLVGYLIAMATKKD